MTGVLERLVEVVQLLDVTHQRLVLLTQLGLAIQDPRHLAVGHAGVGVHHGFVELVTGHAAGGGDGHLAHHAEAVNLRVQGAEAVGEHLRQHGHHELGEVDGVAALIGFGIQRSTGLHIGGHVRDGDPQAPAATALGFTEDGVIEVAGIFPVYGDQRQGAQIDATLFGLLRHLLAQTGNLLGHLFRPGVRDAVGAQGNFNFHARCHVLAQHVQHSADRIDAGGGALGDANDHHLALAGTLVLPFRDDDVLADAAVIRHHEANAVLDEVTTDDVSLAGLEQAHQTRFLTTLAVDLGGLHQHVVAVHQPLHLAVVQEKIRSTTLGAQKTESIFVAEHIAFHQIQTIRQGVTLVASEHELPIALHGAQTTAQGFQRLFVGQLEDLGQLLPGHGFLMTTDKLQQHLAAGDGVIVFFGLALEERIFLRHKQALG
ncbi:hypothetical protein D3C87_534750 [compost metagenome]